MKITVYTITDCQFSKQEKEYLTSHQLQYEEKNLETNKDFLTEMLAVSNNFAGTPVTKIEKDDGQIAVLKGFTKEEFDQTLGFTPAPAAQAQAAASTSSSTPNAQPTVVPAQTPATPPEPPKVPEKPVEKPKVEMPIVPPAPTPEPTNPTPPPSVPPVNQNDAPSIASAKDDPLNSILADLQTKSAAVSTPGAPPSPAPQTGLPSVPDFQK